MLDDVKLEATGKLSESTTNLDIMLGRLGNHVLANGKVDRVLQVTSGSRERWRLVNTANGRFFHLATDPFHAPGEPRWSAWPRWLLEPQEENSQL